MGECYRLAKASPGEVSLRPWGLKHASRGPMSGFLGHVPVPTSNSLCIHRGAGLTLPLLLYGDEGRGPKRANYLEFTVETPFGLAEHKGQGRGCAAELNTLPTDLVPDAPTVMEMNETWHASLLDLNAKGHSYLTRHLVFGLPSYWYKKHRSILDKHLELLVDDMKHLFDQGVEVHPSKKVFRASLIGIKGDMKFHHEIVSAFTRSYAQLSKKANETAMMCSLCHAGDASYQFEECDTAPKWLESQFMDRPWRSTPILARIPYDDSRPEQMNRLDPFHVMKVGLNRDITGSLIMVFARLGMFDTFTEGESQDINERLVRAHSWFRLWCLANKKSPGLRSFTRTFFNAKTYATTPWTNSKGSDSTLLLGFLKFFIATMLDADRVEFGQHRPLLEVGRLVVMNILAIHCICQTHGMWMDRRCAQLLFLKFMLVAKGYHRLARHGLALGLVPFLKE